MLGMVSAGKKKGVKNLTFRKPGGNMLIKNIWRAKGDSYGVKFV